MQETKTPELYLVPFHDDTLVTLEHEGTRYVAVRRVVENMGLSWPRQSEKLQTAQVKFGCCHMRTPSAGGSQTMLCVPVEKLALWLATINPNKVRPDLRDLIKAHMAELEAFGVCRAVRQTSGSQGGPPHR